MATSRSLHELTLHDARDLLHTRQISSVELTRAVLERIDVVEERVKAYVTVSGEAALEQAGEADKAIGDGESGPLTG
ncbi:MAG: amidase family protein, partial [Dehalococcoidia bacterium]